MSTHYLKNIDLKISSVQYLHFNVLISDTDEIPTILDQNQDILPQSELADTRFQSLSREASPRPNKTVNTEVNSTDGKRKRTRSQTSVPGASPFPKRNR